MSLRRLFHWLARPAAARPIAAVFLAVLVSSCDRAPKTSAPPVDSLARVGEHVITAEDFQREIDRRRAGKRPVPAKEALLREMIQREALLQHARAAGVEADAGVQREIENLIVGRLIERELNPRLAAVDVTAAELEAAYQMNLARYTQAARVRLALLFLEAGAHASEARRQEARGRLEEARRRALEHPAPGGRGPAATGFGSLAMEFSDDQTSRHRGGDIGWLDPAANGHRWPRAVLEAGFALPKGGVGPVIETTAGPYLVMKTDHRPATTTPLGEVEAALRQSLRNEKRRALEESYRNEIAQRIGTDLHAEALAALVVTPAPAELAHRGESHPPALPMEALSTGSRP